MRKRKPFARIFSLLAVLVILVSAFSIPAGAYTGEDVYPSTVVDVKSGIPVGTGEFEPIAEAIRLPDLQDDLVLWVKVPQDGGLVNTHGVRCAFGKYGAVIEKPFTRKMLDAVYSYGLDTYMIAVVPYTEWTTFINGNEAPNSISFYVQIGMPYGASYECGVSTVSNFFSFFEYQERLKAYEEGRTNGWQFGYGQGHNDGYLEGQEWGLTQGSKNGYVVGHEDGLAEGYQNGYLAAEGDMEKWGESWYSMVFSVIDAPVEALTEMLNFNVFGVNLNVFVMSLISLCMVIAVVRLFI